MKPNEKGKTPKRQTQVSRKANNDARRRAFIEAYIACGRNGKKAALQAGYSSADAAKQAFRLLENPEVRAALRAREEEIAKKLMVSTEEIIASIAAEIRFNPKALYREDGKTLKSITELDDDTALALAGVEFLQIGADDGVAVVRKVKWANKAQAREQIMRHLGMFERDNEQARPVTKVVMVPPKAQRDDEPPGG